MPLWLALVLIGILVGLTLSSTLGVALIVVGGILAVAERAS